MSPKNTNKQSSGQQNSGQQNLGRFDGKICLVTGASRGIGLAIANQFQAEGGKVITAQRQKTKGFHNYEIDLSKTDDITGMIEDIISHYGQLDVLVNNAGMMREEDIAHSSMATWHDTIALNLTAPFWLMAQAMPYLGKQKGAIVNIGSIEGLGANPGHAAYCASKAGLHGLTKAVAVDGGAYGVRCNAVAPGWIETELNEDFVNAQPEPETFRKRLNDIHPVGHSGATNDIAELVCFLASDAAGFITGQIITADGGRMVQLPLP